MASHLEKSVIIDYIWKQADKKKIHIKSVPKFVSKSQMQKGIKNIDKLVLLNKNNQLDYLTVCDLVRKIYNSFDFDEDGTLDKIESKAMIDTFLQQMSQNDTSSSQEDFRDLFKKIETEIGNKHIVEKQLV